MSCLESYTNTNIYTTSTDILVSRLRNQSVQFCNCCSEPQTNLNLHKQRGEPRNQFHKVCFGSEQVRTCELSLDWKNKFFFSLSNFIWIIAISMNKWLALVSYTSSSLWSAISSSSSKLQCLKCLGSFDCRLWSVRPLLENACLRTDELECKVVSCNPSQCWILGWCANMKDRLEIELIDDKYDVLTPMRMDPPLQFPKAIDEIK